MTLDKRFESDMSNFVEITCAVAPGKSAPLFDLDLWERRLFRADKVGLTLDGGNDETEFEVGRQKFVGQELQRGGVLVRPALSLGGTGTLRIVENPDGRESGQHRDRHTANAVQVHTFREVLTIEPMDGFNAGKYLSGGFH